MNPGFYRLQKEITVVVSQLSYQSCSPIFLLFFLAPLFNRRKRSTSIRALVMSPHRSRRWMDGYFIVVVSSENRTVKVFNPNWSTKRVGHICHRSAADVGGVLHSVTDRHFLSQLSLGMAHSIVLIVILVGLLPFGEMAGNDQCYLNKGGHQCCDRALESAMMSAMAKGDLLSAAGAIQGAAEKKLGGKFEAVVALDDFAYRNHYKDGKTCKVEMGGKYALAWQP